MLSAAAAWAPLVALAPMATAPGPEAVVELAIESGVVPSPPAPPIATELRLVALLPNPSAVAATPVATDSSPKAELHFVERLIMPMAVPPCPSPWAKLP